MNLKPLLAGLLVWMLAFGAAAQQLKCDICGETISARVFLAEDHVTNERKNVCQDCAKLEDRCFVCLLPVKEGYKKLADGRCLCARDAAEAVESEIQAKEICHDVADNLNRVFSRFMTFPTDNVNVSIVDKFHLENLFHAPGSESSSCSSVYGATASNPVRGDKYIHTIDLLSNLRRTRLMAVCAHEYTHAWMGENLSKKRKALLDRDTVEGFCELVAYKFMENRQEDIEMKAIRHNTYTQGQVDVLIAADAQFGFNTVIEWMKFGEDGKLDLEHLGRVRVVQDGGAAGSARNVAWEVAPSAPPPPAPDTLMLKGISDRGNRRFALINDATFEPKERGKVRIGSTNVLVICLEIREKSALIQVNGEKQELFLRVK